MSERLTRPMRGIQDHILDTIYSRDMCTNLLWTSYTRRGNFRQTPVVFYRRMYVTFGFTHYLQDLQWTAVWDSEDVPTYLVNQ